MAQSFDWGEQVFPVPAVVLWHATKFAVKQSGQQVQGIDDFTMLATVKSKVSWTSWGEMTNMQVTTRGSEESILRVESSSGSVTSKTEQHVVLFLSAVRDLLVQNADKWRKELVTETPKTNGQGPDAEERLLKLKQLLDKGLIDKSEYETKREAILGEL